MKGLMVFVTVFLVITSCSISSVVSFWHRPITPANPSKHQKPHIFVILVDDMGFNDLSLRGSNQYFTPNIDALAYNGVILKNYYVPALCTPSRSTLMTGKYPSTIGMQHFVIDSDEPWGLPLEEKIMPEYFQEAGYSTSLFGKWHLGFFRRAYLPNSRGFDHFFGYRGPYIDYWNHELHKLDRNYSRGFDMWENMKPSCETLGNYTTKLITDKAIDYVEKYNLRSGKPMFMYMAHEAPHTANEDDPMQAPQEMIDRFNYIQDPRRRVMAAMMTVLDDQIGRLVKALDNKGVLSNSVILFYSDNGAPTVGMHANGGSNYPFKGQKNSPWEGAVRSAGLIWSPLIKANNRVSNELIYSADWLPTLAQVAGFNIPHRARLDGLEQWSTLSHGRPSPRVEVLHNVDPVYPYDSYLYRNFKYVKGTVNPAQDTWLGDSIPTDENPRPDLYIKELQESPAWKAVSKLRSRPLSVQNVLNLRNHAQVRCKRNLFPNMTTACDPRIAPCLFDIEADPCERNNLAKKIPDMVERLQQQLNLAKRNAVPPRNQPLDPRSDPGINMGAWTYWLDLVEERSQSTDPICGGLTI